MEIKTIVVGPLEENCYLLIKNGFCLVVDPGEEYETIKKEIASLSVLGVLITHHHFDHVGALDSLLADYPVPIYDCSNEEKEYKIDSFTFNIVKNKGHSKDSVRFVFEKEKVMFVGDFVFRGSIGRCDLEGGNLEEMKESIKLLKQETNPYTLYPGHGEKTTLEQEKKENWYFKEWRNQEKSVSKKEEFPVIREACGEDFLVISQANVLNRKKEEPKVLQK